MTDTLRLPPVRRVRSVVASVLLLGLGAAACGAQPQDDSSPASRAAVAVDESIDAAEVGSDLVAPVDGDELETVELHAVDEIDPAAGPDPVELSPLATQVESLPSALPERVLPGLGEPIGFTPLSVSIPEIGIDTASIIPVGLEENGELEVPDAENVGWY